MPDSALQYKHLAYIIPEQQIRPEPIEKQTMRERLSKTNDTGDCRRLAAEIRTDAAAEMLFDLLCDPDLRIGLQAARTLSRLAPRLRMLPGISRERLTDALLHCTDTGCRRMLLNRLLERPLPEQPDPDLLDFCFEKILSSDEQPAIRVLCIKLGYAMALPYPELTRELRIMLELPDPDLLPPSVQAVRRNILAAMHKRRRAAAPTRPSA